MAWILLTAVAWNLSWFVLQAAYVPYAMRSLGLDTQAVGFTLAAYGAGMVLGALAARYPRLDLAGPPVRDRRVRFRGFSALPVRL